MIKSHINLVKHIAYKLYKKFSYFIEFNDLVNYGILGLIEAKKVYNRHNKTKASFATFAYKRVYGKMVDELRKMNKVDIQFIEDYNFLENKHINKQTPENILIDKKIENEVFKSLKILSNQEKKIIILHYYQNISFVEIARLLKVSTARIYQVQKNAIQKLRKFIV